MYCCCCAGGTGGICGAIGGPCGGIGYKLACDGPAALLGRSSVSSVSDASAITASTVCVKAPDTAPYQTASCGSIAVMYIRLKVEVTNTRNDPNLL